MQRLVGSEWTEEPAAEGVALLGLHREVNPPKGERLAQRILELAAAGGRAFIVDLSAVDALDPRAMTPLLRAARREVLQAAYAARPERFARHPPCPPALPTGAWINKPDSEEAAH